MNSLIIILLGIWFCWDATELEAESDWNALFAPIGLAIRCAALAGWLAIRLGLRGGSGGGFGDFGGSDGGGD